MFAQAIDYSHNVKYPQIQRQFLITNSKMIANIGFESQESEAILSDLHRQSIIIEKIM